MYTPAKQFKLTRIAPTPSGYLHLGNALSFALTAALAHTTKANTLLRIDDLDRERVDQAYVEDIFETLKFLGIPWQVGPKNTDEFNREWSQLHRMQQYKPALDELARKGLVFACTCSRKQLQTKGYTCSCKNKHLSLDTPNAAWRLITDSEPVKVRTLTNGEIELHLPAEMKNFVIRKKDGYPAYQLTSLVDDVNFGVDLIVRGEDLWASTVAQLYLAKVLNLMHFPNSTFHHHKLLTINGVKLSKSAGASAIQQMRRQGTTPAQVYGKLGDALSLKSPCRSFNDISNNLLL